MMYVPSQIAINECAFYSTFFNDSPILGEKYIECTTFFLIDNKVERYKLNDGGGESSGSVSGIDLGTKTDPGFSWDIQVSSGEIRDKIMNDEFVYGRLALADGGTELYQVISVNSNGSEVIWGSINGGRVKQNDRAVEVISNR